jgi:lipoate-protein ligase A
VADVRLIIDPPLPGHWNMAVDEALLIDAVENGVATLRFYQWSEPTLSLGYFQQYDDRDSHAASRDCAVVRRQSGGGAILHDRELTYSFVLPANSPLARDAPALYQRVHQAFIAALDSSSHPNGSKSTIRIRGEDAELQPSKESFLCFQRQSPGDVVLTGNPTHRSATAWKVLGSAQRRHRGAILQHGSLLVEQSSAAPELPGLIDLTGSEVAVESLITAVCVEIATSLNVSLVPSELPANLQSKATLLSNTKYGSEAWTKRR